MEAWVTEDAQCSCSELLGSRDEPSPSPSTNLRSESVDSGVEMASSDMSFHATCSSVSTDTTESDGFAADREASTRAPASSVLSGPSPSGPFSPCLPETQDRSSILQQKVEAALQRSNSKHLMDKPAVEVRRRDSRAQQRPASELLRGQRSDRFDLRRTFNPSEPMRLTRHHRSSVASDRLAFQRRLEVRGFKLKGSSVHGCRCFRCGPVPQQHAPSCPVWGKLTKGEVEKKVAEADRSRCFDWSCNTVYEACHHSSVFHARRPSRAHGPKPVFPGD